MNLSTRPRLTATVPSRRGRHVVSYFAMVMKLSFSKPFAATMSPRAIITFSPSVVTFILVTGLKSR